MTSRRRVPNEDAPISAEGPLSSNLDGPGPRLTPARYSAIKELVAELAGGRSVTRLLVFGPTGVGKTSVLARVAKLLSDRGNNVVFCSAYDEGNEPYRTLVSAIPELEELLAQSEEPAGESEESAGWAGRQRRREDGPGTPGTGWYRAAMALDALNPARRLTVIVDDAQLLDRQSSALLELIERSPGFEQISLVLSAVDADQLTVELRRSLLRSDARYLMLSPMDSQEITDLVIHRFRQSTAPVRRALTADLMRRSDGNPAVVEALISMVNPATYTIDDPDPPALETVAYSMESASRFATEGSYRDAVKHLTDLSRIDGMRLNAEMRTLLASSLYQMGALEEADRVRIDLVREALMAADQPAALHAAMLGLPAAEAIDGDQDRLDGLLGVHADELPKDLRHTHAVNTTRLALYAGRTEVAHYWGGQAEKLAATVDQRAANAHVQWHLSALTDGPAARKERISDALDSPVGAEGDGASISPMWRALLHEVRAINNYELGLLDEAAADYGVLGSYAEDAGDSLRQWHHFMFQTTVLLDAGQWQQAEAVRAEAMAYAVQHSLVGGEGLYVAQHFHKTWIADEHDQLVNMFPDLPPEIGKTRIGQAGLVETLRAAGEIDDAIEIGKPLVEALLRNPVYTDLGLIAFLARFVAQTSSRKTTSAVVETLHRRSGTALMLGAGVSSLGPADRYLFHLTGETAFLESAIAFADRAGYRLWQVLLRVEHPDYEEDGTGLLSRQARNLAHGTDLVELLSSR